jgi:hypothetical protein
VNHAARRASPRAKATQPNPPARCAETILPSFANGPPLKRAHLPKGESVAESELFLGHFAVVIVRDIAFDWVHRGYITA